MRITGLSADPTLLLVSNGGLKFYASSTLPDLHMGDTWRISITGQQPFQPVTVAAYHDGNYSSAYLGVTDAQGNFDLHGTFDQGSMGHWQETYRVLGTPVGILLDFSVLPSRTMAPATISAPPPVVTVAPTPSAINPEAMSPATYTTYEQALAATVGANLEPAGPPLISGYAGTAELAQATGSIEVATQMLQQAQTTGNYAPINAAMAAATPSVSSQGILTYTPPTTAPISAASSPASTQIMGGDTDVHGCIPTAGYTWCASKNKCLRTWEEDCPATVPASPGTAETAAAAQPEWISGIPNYAVLAGAAALLLLIARR